MITQQDLHQILNYDPETGIFTWKIKLPHSTIKPGEPIGCLNADGYLVIIYKQRQYKLHRLAWLYVHGYLPKKIDHINRIRHDNRICNLRPATDPENQGNRKINSNNTTGYKGVYWDKCVKKFRAQIRQKGKCIFLGYFATPEEAAKAYNEAASKYFGEFASLNQV